MKNALIFAAGLGTRLKPITDTIPKALVPVAGTPLLGHVAHKLIDAGYDHLVINAHHFAGQIVDYVHEQNGFGVKTDISLEEGLLLETGGGIRHAGRFLEGGGWFMVHNVDILSNLDIDAFRNQLRSNAVAMLHVSPRRSSRYLLFDKDMRLKGWMDGKTSEVRSPWPDLNPDECLRYAFSGIHLISDRIFSIMDSEQMPQRFPIIDFYLRIADRYPIYGVLQEDFRMLDVGKTDTLKAAEEFLESLG